MQNVNIDDVVMIKGDQHKWRVRNSFISIAEVYEAYLEIIGEAWCRTKIVPVADLVLSTQDHSTKMLMLD